MYVRHSHSLVMIDRKTKQ